MTPIRTACLSICAGERCPNFSRSYSKPKTEVPDPAHKY